MKTTNIEQLKTVTGEELMNAPLRPPNFIVDSLLSQGLHILVGAPKVGKSWLALWLVVTVAKNESVREMGITPEKLMELLDALRANPAAVNSAKETANE